MLTSLKGTSGQNPRSTNATRGKAAPTLPQISTARVGHNDGSREASDWLIPLRLAQEAASDWAVAALA
ncbi:hypothetical protein FQA47_023674 [Oryzias melastigma]|uniref:Uncharacterized protein n=1 Tax=Oryzias melastigma TaxID=30732 RepID=A0A834L120_ORYME|nr:hypothetical protein FQA47_023674 [Oryzias melastigma]